MVARKSPTTQAGTPSAISSVPPPPPPRYPLCGAPRPPFDPRLSGLLDLATVAQEALRTLTSALEEEALS